MKMKMKHRFHKHNLMTRQVSLCKEASAVCSSDSGVVAAAAAAGGGGGGKRLITASTWNSILVSVVLYSFQCSAWLTYCGCWYVPI